MLSGKDQTSLQCCLLGPALNMTAIRAMHPEVNNIPLKTLIATNWFCRDSVLISLNMFGHCQISGISEAQGFCVGNRCNPMGDGHAPRPKRPMDEELHGKRTIKQLMLLCWESACKVLFGYNVTSLSRSLSLSLYIYIYHYIYIYIVTDVFE